MLAIIKSVMSCIHLKFLVPLWCKFFLSVWYAVCLLVYKMPGSCMDSLVLCAEWFITLLGMCCSD